MWRRVASDPNRVVPEPVQKEKEEGFEVPFLKLKLFFGI